jgi:hypothetical protein
MQLFHIGATFSSVFLALLQPPESRIPHTRQMQGILLEIKWLIIFMYKKPKTWSQAISSLKLLQQLFFYYSYLCKLKKFLHMNLAYIILKPKWLKHANTLKGIFKLFFHITCTARNKLLDHFPLSVEEHESSVFLQKNESIFRHIDVIIVIGVSVDHPPVDNDQYHYEDEDQLRNCGADADRLRAPRLLFPHGPQPCEPQKIQRWI